MWGDQWSWVKRKDWKLACTLCLEKFPPLNSLYLCQILTDFQNFCTSGKRMKFVTKPIWHYPPHLRYVATLPLEIKNSNFLPIFSRCGKMQTNCTFITSNFVIHPQILIFSVFNIASYSPYWLQIKFSISVLLLLYFCGQFVAPEIRHNRRRCSVCQQSTWYTATRTKFWFKKHKYTQHTQLHAYRN